MKKDSEQKPKKTGVERTKRVAKAIGTIIIIAIIALAALHKMYHDATDSIDKWSGMLSGCSASEGIAEDEQAESSVDAANNDETTYRNEKAGFTAMFPSQPAVMDRSDELDEGSAYASYLMFAGGGDVEFTSVEVMEYASDITVDISAIPDNELNEVMSNGLDSFIVTFSHLHPLNSSRTTHISTIDGYRCASFVEPFSLKLDNGSEIPVVYGYCLDLMTDNKLYHMSGVRESEEEARRALESFDLI